MWKGLLWKGASDFFLQGKLNRKVSFCTGRFSGLANVFLLPGGGGMEVRHLHGFTEAQLMAFVERAGGNGVLVPSWLMETGLRRYLEDYQGEPVVKKCKVDAEQGDFFFSLLFQFCSHMW